MNTIKLELNNPNPLSKIIIEYKIDGILINSFTNFLNYLLLLLAIYDNNRLPNRKVKTPSKLKYFNVLNISKYTQNIANNTNIPKTNVCLTKKI